MANDSFGTWIGIGNLPFKMTVFLCLPTLPEYGRRRVHLSKPFPFKHEVLKSMVKELLS